MSEFGYIGVGGGEKERRGRGNCKDQQKEAHKDTP